MPVFASRKQALMIDASAKDFVYENGDIVLDETQMSDIYHVLAMRYGTSTANPDYGNKAWSIRKLLNIVPTQAEEYVREAVQERIDDGSITEVTVAAEIQGQWLLAWEIGYHDASDDHVMLTLPSGVSVP